MTQKDPLELLSSFYVSESAGVPQNDLFANVLAARRKRTRTIIATTCSFAIAGITAVLVLTMASRPLLAPDHATATAIARYQMIKSGLAERADHGDEVAR